MCVAFCWILWSHSSKSRTQSCCSVGSEWRCQLSSLLGTADIRKEGVETWHKLCGCWTPRTLDLPSSRLPLPCPTSLLPDGSGDAAVFWAPLHYPGEGTRVPPGRVGADGSSSRSPWHHGQASKHCLLLSGTGRKISSLFFAHHLDSMFKSSDITLPTKVHLVKTMVFPVVMYGCESWTVKKAECQRIDAFELWCWRRLLRVPWTARRSNQSILKEISPGCSLEGLMLKLKLQHFGHLTWRVNSLEKTLMLGGIGGRRRRGQ